VPKHPAKKVVISTISKGRKILWWASYVCKYDSHNHLKHLYTSWCTEH